MLTNFTLPMLISQNNTNVWCNAYTKLLRAYANTTNLH